MLETVKILLCQAKSREEAKVLKSMKVGPITISDVEAISQSDQTCAFDFSACEGLDGSSGITCAVLAPTRDCMP